MNTIYLDHASTTPMRPEVIEAVTAAMQQHVGNASSVHQFGRDSRRVMDQARMVIADSLKASPTEIVLTSGGTEADNLAIIGTAMARKEQGRHIITTAVEHHAVLRTCQFLETQGFTVTYLPVDQTGRVSLQSVREAIRPDTILVTVMYGNNEVGTYQPIADIGDLLKETNICFHTDAVQAYTLADINVDKLGVNLLSVSAHKINGPKGIGGLYVKSGTSLVQRQHGGEQERKRRAGTENIPAIAGFAAAVSYAEQDKTDHPAHLQALKTAMLTALSREGLSYEVNGDREQALPHILNIYIPGIQIESLLINLDLAGIAASAGSACTAGNVEPSHVITAMHGEGKRGQASIRFSFGYEQTTAEIDAAAVEVAKICRRLLDSSTVLDERIS